MKQVSKFIDLFNIFFLSNSFLSTSHVMDIANDLVAVKPNYNNLDTKRNKQNAG
jgi:hypothetical protein